MATFLMRCPSCGVPFRIRRKEGKTTEEKTIVGVEHSAFEGMSPAFVGSGGSNYMAGPSSYVDVNSREIQPTKNTVAALKTTHTTSYSCGSCGYAWTINKTEYKTEDGHAISGLITESDQ